MQENRNLMNPVISLLYSMLLVMAHQQLQKLAAAGGLLASLAATIETVLLNATTQHLQTHADAQPIQGTNPANASINIVPGGEITGGSVTG